MTFIHRRRASRRGLAIGASLAVLALAGPAFAQDEAAPEPADAASDDDTAGNVITVTAQFREQNLQDTPIAITAVNAEMMDARSQTQLVRSRAPGAERRLAAFDRRRSARRSRRASAASARATSTRRSSRASASTSTTSTIRA